MMSISYLLLSEGREANFHTGERSCTWALWNPVCSFPVDFVFLRVLKGPRVLALLRWQETLHLLSVLLAGGSMVLSGISCFFLWFGTSESMMIGMLCLYNGLTISAWNSLDVVTVELYPTDRRYVEMSLWDRGAPNPMGPLKKNDEN